MADILTVVNDGYGRLMAFQDAIEQNRASKTKMREIVNAERIFWVTFNASTPTRSSSAATQRNQLYEKAVALIAKIEAEKGLVRDSEDSKKRSKDAEAPKKK